MLRKSCAYMLIVTQLALGFTGCRNCDPYWGSGIRTPQPTVPLPSKLACYDGQPVTADHIPITAPYSTDPRIPLDPNKAPHWNLSLHEAVSTALNNSEVVRTSSLVETFSKVDGVTGRISIYEPQIADTERYAALGAFDTTFSTSMFWNTTELPPGTSFGGIGSRPPKSDGAVFDANLSQPTTLGTTIYGDFSTNYLFIPAPFLGPTPNPQYFSNLSLGIKQPLMQGFGKGVNLAPVGIAAAQATQSVWEFKKESMALVRSVESAYWGLFAAQQNVKVIEEVIPMYEQILRLENKRVEADAATPQDSARADSDLLNYRQQLLEAHSNVAQQQLVLRELMGLQPSDGRYLVLTDSPSTTPLQLDWDATVGVALDNRPDLLRRRLGIHVAELQLLVARNNYRPRLDLDGIYGKNGMDQDLGGSLGQIGSGEFDQWQLGVSFSTPLQRHVGIAGIRQAELTIARERAYLQNDILIATTEVADAMRRIEWVQKQYVVASQRVAAVQEWRKGAQARFDNPPAGISQVLALELYLRNLQALIESNTAANNLLSDYNNAQARLEEVKGTILDSHNVVVQRDPSGEAIKTLGPTERQVDPQDLPSPDNPQGARPRKNTDGQTVELHDYRLKPNSQSLLVPSNLQSANVIDGDKRPVSPNGLPTDAATARALHSSSRRAAGPLSTVTRTPATEPTPATQAASQPTPATVPTPATAPTATPAPQVATTEAKPSTVTAAEINRQRVTAVPLLKPVATPAETNTASVVAAPKAKSVVAKSVSVKKSVVVSPESNVPSDATATAPAVATTPSNPVQTVAVETRAESKPAQVSPVGSRYSAAEGVAPATEQAAASAQPNPLRSRDTESTARLPSTIGDNPFRR